MQAVHFQTVGNSTEILQRIRDLVSSDMDAVSHCIQSELSSNIPLAQQITQHIFKAPGKQLRPLLMMLVTRALFGDGALHSVHYELAVVIEFVHTATLLHDDVVDQSSLRRGQQTAHTIWGNAPSVLVGDFLYSRAFQMLSRYPQQDIMKTLSETTNAIAEGEIMQLMHQRNANLTEENYFHVITKKTARLFSACAEIGAILCACDATVRKNMAAFGLHIGIVFQLIDDLLDYETSADITGKNIGDDLMEGKMTLPLIIAIKKTNAENAAFIRNVIAYGDANALPAVLTILHDTNAFEITRARTKEIASEALQALQILPASRYRDALCDFVLFALERKY